MYNQTFIETQIKTKILPLTNICKVLSTSLSCTLLFICCFACWFIVIGKKFITKYCFLLLTRNCCLLFL